MALVNLLLLALAALSLVFQLVTPVVLNIPAIAVILVSFSIAIFYFRRRRKKTRWPLFAALNLVMQAAFLMLSFAIFFVVTLPNESPEDSPAAVQGIRQLLVRHGWIAKPKAIAPPAVTPPQAETSPERVNAPEAAAVQITVEEAEKPATKETEVQNP